MTLQRMLAALLDVLAPPRCAACGAVAEALCRTCLLQIASFDPVIRRDVPGVREVRALGAYEGALRAAILAMKYANRRDIASVLGRLLACTFAPQGAYLVPVPLHQNRTRQRGCNQAELLARALAASWRESADTDIQIVAALTRVRATRPQRGLNHATREANITSAFAPGPDAAEIAGGKVILVDDVVTTGATLRACAAVLTQCGATAITALCAAAKT